jgi:hypothetical protein
MSGLVWSIALAALGIAGLWRAGYGKRSGWVLGLAAQALWITYALVTHQWGFIASAVAYGFVYARNLLRGRPPVPIHVELVAGLHDALAVLRRAAKLGPITVEQRIRAVHPDWTRAAIAAEADLIRRSGGLS